MDYDWKEIFKEKSTKELYDIYCGNSFLPISVIAFAKKELESRNFDFKNSKNMVLDLQLEALAGEAADIILSLRNRPHYSLKSVLIIMLIFTLPIFLLAGNNNVPIINTILFSAFLLLCVLLSLMVNNYNRKKLIARLERIEKESKNLIDQQDHINNRTVNKTSISDFEEKVQSKVLYDFKIARNIAIIAVVIFIVMLIIKFIFK